MEKIFSNDGQYFVACKDVEMRMSHWVHTPVICTSDGNPVFDLSLSSWSAEEIEWQPDRNQVQINLRCYPGTKPAITLYLDPGTRNCILIENELIRNMPFEKALAYLRERESKE